MVGKREQHQAGMGGYLLHDPVEMHFGSDHRPEMADRLDIFEQADRRLGDILQRLAGGVRKQVKMDT